MTETIEFTALPADWLQTLQTLLLTGVLRLVKLPPSVSCSRFSTGPQLTVYYHPLSCKHQTCCVLLLLCLSDKPAAGLNRTCVTGNWPSAVHNDSGSIINYVSPCGSP